MPYTWDTFVSYFSTNGTNTKRYEELREPVARDLAQVALILEARGSGDLPEGSLKGIEGRWRKLRGDLRECDELILTDTCGAIDTIQVVAPLASELLKAANQVRARVEQREKKRKADTRTFNETVERTLLLLNHIQELGGPSPKRIASEFAGQIIELRERLEAGEAAEALSRLQGITSGLSGLEEAMDTLVRLRKRKPTDLPTKDAQDLASWDKAVLTAIGKSALADVHEPLGDYQAFIVRYERTHEVQRVMSGRHPLDRFTSYKLRVDDILEFPQEFASPMIKVHQQGVDKARLTALQRLEAVKQKELNLEGAKSPTEDELALLHEAVRSAKEAANEALDTLDTQLTAAAKEQATHSRDMHAYYAALKELRPRIELAESLKEQKKGGADTAWKAEKQAYVRARGAVRVEVDPPKRNYATGREKLELLEAAIQALADKKVQSLQSRIDTVTDDESGSAQQTMMFVVSLLRTPGLVQAMKPEQHLALLKSLRTQQLFCTDCELNFTKQQLLDAKQRCPYCDSDEHLEVPACCANTSCLKPGMWTKKKPCTGCKGTTWTLSTTTNQTHWPNGEEHPNRMLAIARGALLSQMPLAPEFAKWDEDKRKKTREGIQQDKEYLSAQDSWATWVGDLDTHKAKIEAFVKRILTIQCNILGHNQKGLTRPGGLRGDSFPDLPVKVKLVTPSPPNPQLYGYCEVGFPTYIVLNTTNRQFGDFKEIIDTIVHENAHAFQGMLVAKLRGEAPFTPDDRQELLDDPDLGVQAQLFDENRRAYVQTESLGGDPDVEQISRMAYRHEPTEEHAWETGGTIAQSLLVPPPVESFESKKVLRSKTWMVESVTIAQSAVVKLKERHGIYVDEWRGEKAKDKKLILEHLLKGGERQTLEVRIAGVVDAQTLKLRLDTRLFDPDLDHPSLVAGQGARLRLDERVQDL